MLSFSLGFSGQSVYVDWDMLLFSFNVIHNSGPFVSVGVLKQYVSSEICLQELCCAIHTGTELRLSNASSILEGDYVAQSALGVAKDIVSGSESFENEEAQAQAENIALLVVDNLLATPGGELIPWLPSTGNFEGLMSAWTRMVRGLLAILRACTRNRSMCSSAGLFRVLQSAEKIFLHDASVELHCI
ncbi:hypothetical protein POM88_051620 [Heracleum sosnowskyi]|uniref:Uncharacterized protein n=1 Tax=Heracleum sosnowskyi TaxID=360622 RepID=A0AAD8H277_9APIA|nr:hypothetical protein POM88_051620 [Heracleum sosnowskyi]